VSEVTSPRRDGRYGVATGVGVAGGGIGHSLHALPVPTLKPPWSVQFSGWRFTFGPLAVMQSASVVHATVASLLQHAAAGSLLQDAGTQVLLRSYLQQRIASSLPRGATSPTVRDLQ
jgi:hypothetical protein